MENNYNLVLETIENYEDNEILNNFREEFEEGEHISKREYITFCEKYIDDMSDMYYINLNWKYIKSGGDEDVFND